MAGLQVELTSLPTATVADVNDFLHVKQGSTDRKISWSNLFDPHISLQNNPHGVTKAQLGLSNVTNDAQLTTANNLGDVQSTSTARFNLDVYHTGYIDNQHNSHANRTDNPHLVNKIDIGLSAVTNALQLIRSNNLSDIPSVNTARTNLDVYSKAQSDAIVTSHANLSSNPHNVTKSQIGLSAVTNNRQLNQSSNLSDVANASTCRANLQVYSTAQTDALHNGHANLTSNPHGVNKSQVGLSNLQNWTFSTSPTDGSTNKYARADAVRNLYDLTVPHVLPTGCIVLWSGAINSIPSGWKLCNGTSGTPDLRSRFVIGAGSTYDPNDTGGTSSHKHNTSVAGHVLTIAEMPSHGHPYRYAASGSGSPNPGTNLTGDNVSSVTRAAYNGAPADSAGRQIGGTGGNGAHAHGISESTINHLPPYYALAYIMKTI